MVGAAHNAFVPVPAALPAPVPVRGFGLGSGRVPVSARRWAGGKASRTLLASLLVLALLLCHGAMGGFHQVSSQFAASASGAAHGHADHASALPEALAEASPAAGPDGESPAGHGEGHPAPFLPPPGFYLAGLLVVLLALVLGPALRGAAPLPVSGPWAARRPPPVAFLPARTPTVSSLQVFRL